MRMGRLKFWVYLILANLFWSGNLIFGSYIVEDLSPLWITFLRWSLALILLIPISFFLESYDWRLIKKEFFLLLLLGVLGVIAYNMLLMGALEYTSATNAALINALNPAIIVFFSFLLLRESLSKVQLSGLLLSLIGVFVILTKGNLIDLFEIQYNRGDLLTIAALVVWALYSILAKKLKSSPIVATTVSTFLSVLLMIPFVFLQGTSHFTFTTMSLVGILYMVIFPCVLAYILWNISVRELGVSIAGVSMNLIPVFTAILAIWIGDKITVIQIAGGFLVFVGVYLNSGLLNKRIKILKSSSKQA